jgi:hypothetical protein
MSELDNNNNTEGLVVTPGGPRRPDKVHRVSPGEAIVREEGGALAVVSQAHRSTPQLKALLKSGEYVIAPGGPRRKELVHVVKPGEAVMSEDGVLRKLDRSGAPSDLPAATAADARLPALGTGWITSGEWTYAGSTPIVSFSTTWTVPPAPTHQGDQTIFLFNGLLNNSGTTILQPVLQWGESADSGGNHWAVASWLVGQNSAYWTGLVEVREGDILTGLMTLTGRSRTSFDYRCEFVGLEDTVLFFRDSSALVLAVETLECYGIEGCRSRWSPPYHAPPTTSTCSRSAATARSTPPTGPPTPAGSANGSVYSIGFHLSQSAATRDALRSSASGWAASAAKIGTGR